MGKKKGMVVWRQSAEEATLAKMPRYNAYGVGHGPHANRKRYDRNRSKRAWRSEIENQGSLKDIND